MDWPKAYRIPTSGDGVKNIDKITEGMFQKFEAILAVLLLTGALYLLRITNKGELWAKIEDF